MESALFEVVYMGIDQITMVIFTAVITGGFSAAATVVGLKVHISYLRDAIARQEMAIQRAHERIDTINVKLNRAAPPAPSGMV